MAYPRFQRARAFKHLVKNGAEGNYSTSSTTYVAVDTTLDITLEAQAGDVFEVGFQGLPTTGATPVLLIDAATLVSGSVVNYASQSGATGNGVPAWMIRGSDYHPAGGAILYTVVAGDLANGLVTVRLLYKVETAGTRGIQRHAAAAVHFWAKNLGPVDPN